MSDYDHLRDLLSGDVALPGIELQHVRLPIEEIFRRFIATREWDVSEMSMGKYAALVAQGDASITALPVFPSRMFRHSAVYVRTAAALRRPEDLAGRRIGIPEWAQTAVIYARAFLMHEHGLRLESVEWVQGGVNRPGGAERVALQLPPGVRVVHERERTLDLMLVDGEIDALIAAHPPKSFADGNPAISRLFSDPHRVEQDYWRATGIFPMMHVVALRADTLAVDPTLATRLFDGFVEARDRSVARLLDSAASRFPLPWVAALAEAAQAQFGGQLWPYGVAANRPTLEAFLQFAHEQGVTARRLTPGELFHASVRDR